jgi:hypothetical protein
MRYLVDLGRLITVNGVTARDAFSLALVGLDSKSQVDRLAAACVYLLDQEGVYELGQEGKDLIGVVPCELEERERALETPLVYE